MKMVLDPDIKRLLDSEEAGRERRSNHLRLAILALFLVMFAIFYLKSEQHYTAGYVILADFLALFVYGLFLERLLRRDWYKPFLKYVSFGSDLTCVSVMVASSLFLSRGADPNGWLASIAVYFLFIALTGMRFSARLCIFMGGVAAVQFLLINEFAQAVGGQGLPVAQRLVIAVLMVVTGLVLAASAHNARRLVLRIGLAERERAHFEGVAEVTRRLAITDELTGLYNRRHFYEEFNHELARAERHGRPLAVLVIDIDRFKDINDRLGHQVGDEVLRQITSVLGRLTRASDVVARIGGDELAILLAESDALQARILAERLCHGVRNHSFESIGDMAGLRPTLSIGLACFPSDGRDVDTLLASADKALYLAKNLGRDRVEHLVGDPISAASADGA